jgi:hypothetical protein
LLSRSSRILNLAQELHAHDTLNKHRSIPMTDPVQHQFEAFNNRDLDAFMEAYASNTQVEDGTGEKLMSGTEEMRAFYGNVFENSPDLHCELVNRTTVGDWVFDEEQFEGLNAEGFPEEARAVAAYQVRDGQITLVRMYT